MDQHKLRSLVFEKTGIKIDTTDPVFALVALNEVLLEEAVQRHLGMMEATSRQMLEQWQQIPAFRNQLPPSTVAGDGDIWESPLPHSSPNAPNASNAPMPAAQAAGTPAPTAAAPENPSALPQSSPVTPAVRASRDWLAHALTAVASALLVLVGQAVFGPRPALSSAQEAQLRQAEKLQKILPSLEPKLRSQLEAELQKQ